MKKYVITSLFLFVSSIILATTAVALSTKQITATEVDFKIVINEEEYTFNLPIMTIEGRAYLPAREFCNAIGYSINWDEEGRVVSMLDENALVFDDDIFSSREGVLENGRKYIFYGADKHNFSLKDYIEKCGLFVYTIYDVKIKEETLEKTLEKVQELSDWGLQNVENAGIVVHYDSDTEAFLFTKINYGRPQAGGISVIVLTLNDGIATLYVDGTA